MERVVHFDLKGAPLKISYLEKVLLAAKSWGATGILLEWEDTFPYSLDLVCVGSQIDSGGDGMYTLNEVNHILQFAKENALEPIQLVQTIGHMEFVLKHPAFKNLREEPRSPAVLCPSKPQSQVLVRAMLEQILEVQPDANYLHIGADEVWHTAICAECQARAASSAHKTASLYLDHIRDLALFLKQKRPNLTILMWDDMLRSVDIDTLRSYQLSELIQPVLWNYSPVECFYIDPKIWNTYREIFPNIWVGSAFKGANGSSQIVAPVARYVRNHEAWLLEMKRYSSHIEFVGVILTGWSRYDHYATLCELMPVSLPSLSSCLKVLNKADDCSTESLVREVLPSEEWPGEKLAQYIYAFVVLRNKCQAFDSDIVQTWLNPWQLQKGYTNPIQVGGVLVSAQHLSKELEVLQTELTTHLSAITGPRSVEEWIGTFVAPVVNRIAEILKMAEARNKVDAGVVPLS